MSWWQYLPIVAVAGTVLLIGGTIAMSFSGMLFAVKWAGENEELTERFEDACNDRFGYEWEFEITEDLPDQLPPNYTVRCTKDMGFLSETTEEITVNVGDVGVANQQLTADSSEDR
jgi:hypothetical protein